MTFLGSFAFELHSLKIIEVWTLLNLKGLHKTGKLKRAVMEIGSFENFCLRM